MVRNILGMVAGGATVADVMAAYPELSESDVRAALEYAAKVVDAEKVSA